MTTMILFLFSHRQLIALRISMMKIVTPLFIDIVDEQPIVYLIERTTNLSQICFYRHSISV